MAETFEKYDLFVGNLMSVTTIEQIKELFKIAGAVKNVRLLFDKVKIISCLFHLRSVIVFPLIGYWSTQRVCIC